MKNDNFQVCRFIKPYIQMFDQLYRLDCFVWKWQKSPCLDVWSLVLAMTVIGPSDSLTFLRSELS